MNRQDAHHLEHVLGTVTALINAGAPAADEELLGDVAALDAFVRDRLITETEPPTVSDVAALQLVRSQLRAVFVAPDDAARADIVNRLLAAATIAPRLTDHDGIGVHLHFFPPYASLADHLLADCAMALAIMLASGEGGRLRLCTAPGCARVMVDASRNRSRNFCDSGRCGNRVNAAAYRRRQREEAAASKA